MDSSRSRVRFPGNVRRTTGRVNVEICGSRRPLVPQVNSNPWPAQPGFSPGPPCGRSLVTPGARRGAVPPGRATSRIGGIIHEVEDDVTHVLIPEVPVTPSQQSKHKRSVLVVTAEPASLKPLFTILTEDGYAVRALQLDPDPQLRLVKDVLPDLVLVDARMPGMDGDHVCARLTNDPITRAIPVI